MSFDYNFNIKFITAIAKLAENTIQNIAKNPQTNAVKINVDN